VLQYVAVRCRRCSVLHSVWTAVEGDSCNLRRSLLLSLSLSLSHSLLLFLLAVSLARSLLFFVSISLSLSLSLSSVQLHSHDVRAAQRDTPPTCEGD